MAMDVWRREDILNALRAAQLAHENFLCDEDDPVVQAYNAGFQKALRAIGANFGIQLDGPAVRAEELRRLRALPLSQSRVHS